MFATFTFGAISNNTESPQNNKQGAKKKRGCDRHFAKPHTDASEHLQLPLI
jgi:hypothetical protein